MQIETMGNNSLNDKNEKPETPKRFYRCRKEGILSGVCAGLSKALDVPAGLIRFLFILLAIWGGIGAIIYIAFTLLMKPSDESLHEKNKSLPSLDSFWGILLLAAGIIFLFENTFVMEIVNIFDFSNTALITITLFGISFLLFDRRNDFLSEPSSNKKLKRSTTERKFSGVCGGIAEYFNINPNLTRMIWMIFGFASVGIGVLVYILFSLILGEDGAVESE